MKQLKYIYLLVIIFISLSSCASFKKGLENENPITKNNLNTLESIYNNNSKRTDSLIKKWNRKGIVSGNFLNEIDRKLIKDTLHMDTLKVYKFELKILSKKRLAILYIENDSIFRQVILKYKIKKDGYVYLKNKNVQPLLIPYLCGAIDIKRMRLSLNKSNELVLDMSHHRSGAFLIVAFLDGRTWKNRYQYSKSI